MMQNETATTKEKARISKGNGSGIGIFISLIRRHWFIDLVRTLLESTIEEIKNCEEVRKVAKMMFEIAEEQGTQQFELKEERVNDIMHAKSNKGVYQITRMEDPGEGHVNLRLVYEELQFDLNKQETNALVTPVTVKRRSFSRDYQTVGVSSAMPPGWLRCCDWRWRKRALHQQNEGEQDEL